MYRALLPVFILVLATAAPVQANVVRPLEARPGVSELRIACSKAGGTFSVHADGGGYGCETKNCDGEGGSCIIACDNNNNCNGSTPSRIVHPVSLIGILQDGDNIVRKIAPVESEPSGSSGGSSEESAWPSGPIY